MSHITLFKEVIGNFVLQNLCICAATVKVCRLCTSDFAARSHAREWSRNLDHRSMRLSRFTVEASREYRSRSLVCNLSDDIYWIVVFFMLGANWYFYQLYGERGIEEYKEMFNRSCQCVIFGETKANFEGKTIIFANLQFVIARLSVKRRSNESIRRRGVQIGYRMMSVCDTIYHSQLVLKGSAVDRSVSYLNDAKKTFRDREYVLISLHSGQISNHRTIKSRELKNLN